MNTIIEYGAEGIPIPEFDHIHLIHPMIHLKTVSDLCLFIFTKINICNVYILYICNVCICPSLYILYIQYTLWYFICVYITYLCVLFYIYMSIGLHHYLL